MMRLFLLFCLAAGPLMAQSTEFEDLNRPPMPARGPIGQKAYRVPDGIDLRLDFPDKPDAAGIFTISARATSTLFKLENVSLRFNASEGLEFVGKAPEWRGGLEIGQPATMTARLHYVSARPEESLGVQMEYNVPDAALQQYVKKNADKEFPDDEMRRRLLESVQRAAGSRAKKWKAALLVNPGPRESIREDN
ncbi:MAG: hypothetical protein HY303_13675 [Candidatus Wallbacteria bacterium]|nr:hypothetical protein [Candidatus Wallbacteria bacterium]